MIDISSESVVSLTQATKHVPPRRPGTKTAVSTIWRWAMRGIRGVRLETIMVGGTRCTSIEAIQRFCERVTQVADGAPLVTQTCRQRQARLRSAESELEAAGI